MCLHIAKYRKLSETTSFGVEHFIFIIDETSALDAVS